MAMDKFYPRSIKECEAIIDDFSKRFRPTWYNLKNITMEDVHQAYSGVAGCVKFVVNSDEISDSEKSKLLDDIAQVENSLDQTVDKIRQKPDDSDDCEDKDVDVFSVICDCLAIFVGTLFIIRFVCSIFRNCTE